MSDLAATNCGCGCEAANSGCDNNGCNWIWIILLLSCCGGCGNGFGGCGNGFGGDNCCWIILLLLFCGGGCGNSGFFGNGNGCGCGC